MRTLLALDWSRKADCEAARDTLDEHLAHVRTRLAELQTLADDLQALRGRCDGTDTHCHIIEALHLRADAEPPPALQPSARRHV